MNELKLTHELFVGKVIGELGFDKTIELLKEAKEAIKPITKGQTLPLVDVSGTFTAEDMKNFAAKIWLTRNKDNIKPLDEELEIFCRIDR